MKKPSRSVRRRNRDGDGARITSVKDTFQFSEEFRYWLDVVSISNRTSQISSAEYEKE